MFGVIYTTRDSGRSSYKDLQLYKKKKCYFDIFQQSMSSILTLPQVHSCHTDQLYCYYISWKTSDKKHASPEVWQCSDLWTLPACPRANSLHPIFFPPLLTTLHTQLFVHRCNVHCLGNANTEKFLFSRNLYIASISGYRKVPPLQKRYALFCNVHFRRDSLS